MQFKAYKLVFKDKPHEKLDCKCKYLLLDLKESQLRYSFDWS